MKRLTLMMGAALVLAVAASAHGQDGTQAVAAASSSSSSSAATSSASEESTVADLQPGEAPSDALKALLDRTRSLSHKYGQMVADAVQSSPRLTAQLNALVASGQLSDIVVQKGNDRVYGTNFRGAVVAKQIIVTEGLLRDVKPRPYAMAPGHIADSTVFVLGHLAYHAQHDADQKAKNDAAGADLFAHPAADGSVDATQFILQMTNGDLDLESRAFFQGWNDMVDAATITKGQAVTLEDVGEMLTNTNYGMWLARSMMQPGGSLKWDPASGYLFASDYNVKTMIATLRDEPVADIQ